MELSERDKELLLLYRADKKKKRRRAILTIITFTCLSSGSIFAYKHQDLWLPYFKSTNNQQIIPDHIPPTIALNEDSIEITQGETIDYLSFLKAAYDNDEDLYSDVTWNEIDTNTIGEYKVIFKVTDQARNYKSSCLDVLVKEKPTEVEPYTPPNNNNEAPSNRPTITTPNDEDPSTQQEKPPIPQEKPATKYFWFSDGYTMENVANACGNALKSSGRSGICTPIQDSDGIYLGMRLDFD